MSDSVAAREARLEAKIGNSEAREAAEMEKKWKKEWKDGKGNSGADALDKISLKYAGRKMSDVKLKKKHEADDAESQGESDSDSEDSRFLFLKTMAKNNGYSSGESESDSESDSGSSLDSESDSDAMSVDESGDDESSDDDSEDEDDEDMADVEEEEADLREGAEAARREEEEFQDVTNDIRNGTFIYDADAAHTQVVQIDVDNNQYKDEDEGGVLADERRFEDALYVELARWCLSNFEDIVRDGKDAENKPRRKRTDYDKMAIELVVGAEQAAEFYRDNTEFIERVKKSVGETTNLGVLMAVLRIADQLDFDEAAPPHPSAPLEVRTCCITGEDLTSGKCGAYSATIVIGGHAVLTPSKALAAAKDAGDSKVLKLLMSERVMVLVKSLDTVLRIRHLFVEDVVKRLSMYLKERDIESTGHLYYVWYKNDPRKLSSVLYTTYKNARKCIKTELAIGF